LVAIFVLVRDIMLDDGLEPLWERHRITRLVDLHFRDDQFTIEELIDLPLPAMVLEAVATFLDPADL
jgi:hypothetical protein